MKIFISYRRDDSAGYAGRLFEHLTAHFGARNVFMDIDTIEPGEDFRKVIRNAVGTCDVVLVMIGKHWLKIADAQGQRRLDDPQDWVRAEIADALANPHIRVIPVLVRDAAMPDIQDLPEDIKELSWRNAIELSDNRFQYDANQLIRVIERAGIKPAKTLLGRIHKVSRARYWGIVLGVFGLGLVIWLFSSGIIPLTVFKTSTPQGEFVDVPQSTMTSIPDSTVVSTNELLLIRTIPAIPGSSQISSTALSPDGQIVAAGSYDGTIRLWSTSEDILLVTLDAGTGVTSLAFSKDSQMLAAGLVSTVVKVWRLSDGTPLTALEGLPGVVYSVAFSPDGRFVAGGADANVILWRVSDATLLHSFEAQTDHIYNLAFSPNGLMLASGSYQATKLWQVEDDKLVRDLPGGGSGKVAFSPLDGEILARTGDGGRVYLWRVRDGQLLHELAGHTQGVESIAFSIDGLTLVSVSNDIEVRRWQVSDGTRQYTRTMDGQNVRFTLLSEDGRILMVAYSDDTVKLWQVP
jgi:TIR domain/WD domain, G-beta repeat